MTPENAALAFLSQLINGSPYEGRVFVAGGFVRDEVMGRTSKDIDLVVDTPNGGIEFARWVCAQINRLSDANPVIFPRFGTAKFNLRGQVFNGIDISGVDIEAVMPRDEVYDGESRKPDVQYATMLRDAQRRDFTVNSMFKDLTTGAILDLTKMGRQDIRDGIIRTSLDPKLIFAEDPLRMLRAIRFAVRFDWILPFQMLIAIQEMAPAIMRISAERVQEELNKMLLADRPSGAFYIMRDTGLLALILPEIAALVGVTQNEYHSDDAFVHTMKVLDSTPSIDGARLAALFHDIGKPVTRTVVDGKVHFYDHENVGAIMASVALRRLKYPTDVISFVELIVRNHMRLKGAGPQGDTVTDKTLRRFREDVRIALFSTLNVIHADNCNHAPGHDMPDQVPNLLRRLEVLMEVAPKVILPINGHDVMTELGLRPGPQIKMYLDAVKDAWFENPALTREEAISLIHGLSLIDR